MTSRILLLLLFLDALATTVRSQNRIFEFQAVYDSTYGIDYFDRYNSHIGNDSVRKHEGYAYNGATIDKYPDGKTIHKGYYIDGQLRTYTNFYPNGQTERVFKMLDDLRSKMTKFYDDGKTKCEVTYRKGMVDSWKDFFTDGKVEMEEEYLNESDIYVYHKEYYPGGQLALSLEITNKKKKLYKEVSYYENGKVKESGEKFYDENTFYYQKNGKWQYFKEDGSPEKEENYQNGVKLDP